MTAYNGGQAPVPGGLAVVGGPDFGNVPTNQPREKWIKKRTSVKIRDETNIVTFNQ